MLGRVLAAQSDLEKAIADLNRKFLPTPSASIDQLHALATLLKGIGAANAADLPGLRAEVMATIAATHDAIKDNRASVAEATAADALGLSGSAAARQQVLTTMAAMQQFEPYLRFASPGDERDYRNREDERRRYIDGQLAKGTPEGNLNASAGTIGQMVDAKLHGAGDSPEFQQRWDGLVASTARLRDEVQRSGGSTEEFDRRLRKDLRRILKAKGLTDPQIDAQFAANPDPLEAAKAFVGAGDVQTIAARADFSANSALAGATPTSIVAAGPSAPQGSLDDAVNDLKAFGFATSDHSPADDPQHGVALASAQPVSAKAQPQPGR